MMYNNKLVACVKVGGKILREVNETVYVPFGSEYSLFLSNKDSRRVRIEISIDGRDVFPGSALVLGAHQNIDLERFVEDHTRGHKFKFIERTPNIEDHRGIGSDDGLIQIKYKFEIWKYTPSSPIIRKTQYGNGGQSGSWNMGNNPYTMNAGSDMLKSSNSITGSLTDIQCNASATMDSFIETNANDAGITVNGSISEQQFQTVASLAVESVEHVMVFKLLGHTANNKPVLKAVDVKAVQTCPTCGRKNKIGSKFCSECGTNLEVI